MPNQRVNIDIDLLIKTCNESCSMSEACRKLGLKGSTFKRYALLAGVYNTNQAGKGMDKTRILSEDIFTNRVKVSRGIVKWRLMKVRNNFDKCEECSIREWRGKSISLELHHKDGDGDNNAPDNLMLICPNCHSQTDTFRRKKNIAR